MTFLFSQYQPPLIKPPHGGFFVPDHFPDIGNMVFILVYLYKVLALFLWMYIMLASTTETGRNKMKGYKVTVKAKSGSISYEVRKTLKGAKSFGKRLANEAFYGEKVEIKVEAI